VSHKAIAEMQSSAVGKPTEKAPAMPRNRGAETVVLGSVLFAAAGHLLIKSGLNTLKASGLPAGVGPRVLSYALQPAVMGGLAIYGIGTLLWIFAVSKRDISYLFPLSALNYVVVALGGMWLFGESIPGTRWAGILVVFAGVWLMQRWGVQES
jgi:drug/metabolite transporter (DMT)-like permease